MPNVFEYVKLETLKQRKNCTTLSFRSACVRTCQHTHTHMHAHIHRHAHTDAHRHRHRHKHKHTHTHTRTHAHTHTHTQTRTHARVCVRLCVHTCASTHATDPTILRCDPTAADCCDARRAAALSTTSAGSWASLRQPTNPHHASALLFHPRVFAGLPGTGA